MDSLDIATKANVVIGLIAVAGSLGGALLGAWLGAKATRDATTKAIEAERVAANEQRLHEDRTRFRALATECRLNASTLREARKYRPEPRYMAPLRQSALDAATAALADPSDDDWEQAQPAIRDVLWFNQLIATRLLLIDEAGDKSPRALHDELQKVGGRLPCELDAIASRLDLVTAGRQHGSGATEAAP